MRFTHPISLTLVVLALSGLPALAAPIPAAGDSSAAVTAPLIDTALGSDNVNSVDAIADTLSVAQYNSEDNAEDQNALPQQTLGNLIGSDGAVTSIVEGSPVRRATVGQALRQELEDRNRNVY